MAKNRPLRIACIAFHVKFVTFNIPTAYIAQESHFKRLQANYHIAVNLYRLIVSMIVRFVALFDTLWRCLGVMIGTFAVLALVSQCFPVFREF